MDAIAQEARDERMRYSRQCSGQTDLEGARDWDRLACVTRNVPCLCLCLYLYLCWHQAQTIGRELDGGWRMAYLNCGDGSDAMEARAESPGSEGKEL